ncbi:caspase domain-containing protein [Pseudorhodoferax soli]|uniref:Caspase domain-containing protein n=2 Tax=Pseudorhodoferax soli TaxID=545864 RepID=A0A368XTB9_9BURK|nr:caspase domain-containing protein [Pseudorhodoferax soli]
MTLSAFVCGSATLLGGCLAISDAIAPKVTFKQPARSAEASALRSVIILADSAEVSQQMSMGLESEMSKLRVDERPYYTTAKLGQRITAQPSDAQLSAMARSAGVDAVVVVTGGGSSVTATQSTEDRYSCAVNVKLFKSCPKDQSRTTKMACTTTLGSAAARVRIVRAVDARSVFVDVVNGQAKHYRCNDQDIPQADRRQIAYDAVVSATTATMQILAPSYVQGPLDLMKADAGLPAEVLKRFDAASEFAKAKRLDEACSRFEELYTDYKESTALTFNVAFCHEVRGDMLRANQAYKRASELANAPDAQIDRRLTLTEKALRENPAVFMPANPNAAATQAPAGKVAASGNGRRVALVIGNARYQRSALVNPVNDARLVGERLKRIGFDVVTLENLDSARFGAATRDFGARAKGAEIALFYYAGHALQADGENFLMPVDNAKMRTMEDVRDGGGVQLAAVVAQLDVAAPAVKLLVVDACRDNPLPSANRSLAGGGLAPVKQPPEGGLIAFATAPGRTAEDGTGKNSVFSKHFADQLMVANQTVEQLFKRVRAAVKSETKNRQEPTEISSLVGDVVLATSK